MGKEEAEWSQQQQQGINPTCGRMQQDEEEERAPTDSAQSKMARKMFCMHHEGAAKLLRSWFR